MTIFFGAEYFAMIFACRYIIATGDLVSIDGAQRLNAETLAARGEAYGPDFAAYPQPAWAWNAATKTLDALAATRVARISPSEFIARFTPAELRAVYTAAEINDDLFYAVKRMETAREYIDLDDAATVQYLGALEQGGLLAAGRASQIRGLV
jgi:hypothetical protein